jgi:hypothetical protein
MALTPAEKQQRYRDRRSALAASRPDVVEAALVRKAARCSELSDAERVALADRLMELASHFQWRASALAKLAHEVRGGLVPPGFPP